MEFLKKNWISLDTLNNYCRLIELPEGVFYINGNTIKIDRNTFVTSTLVTNKLMIEMVNANHIENHINGVYRYFNDVNTTNNIYINKDNKYAIKKGFENHPFRGVTWEGALLISNFFGGRLLSELEWELCAKSGHEEYCYPWGNSKPNYQKANYGNFYGNTTEVNMFKPNEWGFFDMAGNLREWCMDFYRPDEKYIYDNHYNENISSCYFPNRVVKGGAWDKTEYHLCCDLSEGKWSRIGTMGIGFRILIKTN